MSSDQPYIMANPAEPSLPPRSSEPVIIESPYTPPSNMTTAAEPPLTPRSQYLKSMDHGNRDTGGIASSEFPLTPRSHYFNSMDNNTNRNGFNNSMAANNNRNHPPVSRERSSPSVIIHPSFSSVPHGDVFVGDDGTTKGSVQPKRCNDFAFALLFYVHLGLMGWAASNYGPAMVEDVTDAYANYSDFLGYYNNNNNRGRRMTRILYDSAINAISGKYRRLEDDEEEEENNYESNISIGDVVLLMGVSTIFCSVVSSLALCLLMNHSSKLIKISLIVNIVIGTFVTALAFLAGSPFGGIIFLLLTVFVMYYAWAVWARIPFAATNMKTAVTSIRKNGGIIVIAYGSLLFLFGWSVWWIVAFVASMYATGGCSADGVCENDPNGWIVFAFLISYFWTHQIIKNTLHVTVAGTVGTWWFSRLEATSFCSRAVLDSFLRSVIFSFGSICLGSLIVAIVEATRDILDAIRHRGDSVLLCCAECFLKCIEMLVEYFNTWAFVFVGVYGYSFVDAGRNVVRLFRARGWTAIITDSLVDNVLFLVSLGVGLITGVIASIVANSKGMLFGNEAGTLAIPFIIGLVIGFVLTSVAMSVVSSAVNTVIVCYAEAPNEFQTSHPELSNEMRTSWRQAWPLDFKY